MKKYLARPHLHLSIQFAVFQHTPWSSLFIIHNGTLMFSVLPVVLFLKYGFAKSPKFSLSLKNIYNLRSLEGSVLMYFGWRWVWGKVLWIISSLQRSHLGRWCSWDYSSLTRVPERSLPEPECGLCGRKCLSSLPDGLIERKCWNPCYRCCSTTVPGRMCALLSPHSPQCFYAS